MIQNLFKNYNYLGFYNPFFISKEGKFEIDSFSNLIKKNNDNIQIDNTAIIEILTKDYALGNRTIIKGLCKTPWMAKPNKELTKWEFYTKLRFNDVELNKVEIAETLFTLLKEEIVNYVKNKKRIGILLSGGMDSRIVAGVLDSLIKNKEIKVIKVKAFTWGKKSSRDVVYAKEIAKRLKWDWQHFEMTSDDMLQNIKETAVRGCEFSPIHLHAMLKVREDKEVDCILAGSYGDSIGRGEYSGKNIFQLTDVRKGIDNKYGILKKSVIKRHFGHIDKDILSSRNIFPQKKNHQRIEQDYQIHYWRRMLNPCMSVINEKIPLNQAFTSPDIVSFMWSLNPVLRNNEVYKELLKIFNTNLRDIPWARTGLKFDETVGVPDVFGKTHYSYSDMLNEDIFQNIKDLVLSKNIEKLNIFNMKTLEGIFMLMKTPLYYKDIILESKLIWLGSLSMFIDLYKVDLQSKVINKNSFYDMLNMFYPLIKNVLKKAKYLLK